MKVAIFSRTNTSRQEGELFVADIGIIFCAASVSIVKHIVYPLRHLDNFNITFKICVFSKLYCWTISYVIGRYIYVLFDSNYRCKSNEIFTLEKHFSKFSKLQYLNIKYHYWRKLFKGFSLWMTLINFVAWMLNNSVYIWHKKNILEFRTELRDLIRLHHKHNATIRWYLIFKFIIIYIEFDF